jgi:two-component system, NarL family, nitrate/nitrite response regulator NarL
MAKCDQRLTERDELVIRHLVSGATNREIALRTGLCEQTVKNRLSAIYSKLGLRNRLELTVYLSRMAASEASPAQN